MTLQQRRVLSGFRAIPLAILALLLVSCSTLTPDRIQVLAQIAGAAAQLGAQEWLAAHPDHRAAFNQVIMLIRALVAQGVTDPGEYVKLLESLPTSHFSAKDGDLMWSGVSKSGQGVARLFVWDGPLQKTVPITGPAVLSVMKSAMAGLKRATVPQPPTLPPARVKRTVIQTNVVDITNIVVHWLTTSTPTNKLVVTPSGEPTDATLDAEFQQYLAAKAKTNGSPRKVRIFRPGVGLTNEYQVK